MGTTTTVTTTERPQYPIGVPDKFSPEGVVQYYPGNTTLCHVPPKSPLIPRLQKLYNALQSHPMISKRIQLLPPSSWHMTVLDGVREKECEPGMWPAGKEKAPLADCTKEFAEEVQKLGRELEKDGLAPPYRMRAVGFGDTLVGIGLRVEGATAEEEKRMRRLRDRLADAVGFKAPNHDVYEFHLSVAYLLRHIDGEDREEMNRFLAEQLKIFDEVFELGAVEFCTFDDMYLFTRLFYLGA
ncbi:hypothetical protein BU24DRAFT_448702 [Aaosphaeria arxii CBS 175.79]|uniref:DUF1868 domain-containing protein n=1 Tax=Aaosphaeria arxii CBS 175.79 TaxID=1450172 RepID=A0A6A5XUB6_9PLEO|nr:uncharacterized protein BU24DRAFT_448702 [Aaosphaeria arxii CBS 175.79]KAF2016908.1 hypothetical protein BU24DRAFT_448702 [Aaosphaeria arxii CBS 175.79]